MWRIISLKLWIYLFIHIRGGMTQAGSTTDAVLERKRRRHRMYSVEYCKKNNVRLCWEWCQTVARDYWLLSLAIRNHHVKSRKIYTFIFQIFDFLCNIYIYSALPLCFSSFQYIVFSSSKFYFSSFRCFF